MHSLLVASQDVIDSVMQLRKTDDSALTLSRILEILPLLKLPKKELEAFVPDINRMISQADEVDGTFLYVIYWPFLPFLKTSFISCSFLVWHRHLRNGIGRKEYIRFCWCIGSAATAFTGKQVNGFKFIAKLVSIQISFFMRILSLWHRWNLKSHKWSSTSLIIQYSDVNTITINSHSFDFCGFQFVYVLHLNKFIGERPIP